MRTHVTRFADESAIVVDRYDRHRQGARTIRIHQEDICRALGVSPSRKYQNEGGPGPRDVARLLRGAMSPRAADEAIWRFFDALAWNWLIAGTDAHAKNYSLLLLEGQARLAPLYDIASALPYGTHEKKLRFAMKIGGDYRVFPYRNTWMTAADDLGIDREHAVERVEALAARAADALADAASSPEVASLERSIPVRLVDLVADRVERCRRLLRTTSAVGAGEAHRP